MTTIFNLHPEASFDIHEAYHWYEGKQLGVGDRFVEALEEVFGSIRQHPGRFPLYDWGIRKFSMNRFPFVIYYLFEDDAILILSVMHGSRDPDIIFDRFSSL